MSGTVKELLKSTVSLGTVLTLLCSLVGLAGSGAYGIWQCKDTLDHIDDTLGQHGQRLDATQADTRELKSEFWALKSEQEHEGYVLTDIQKKVDSTDKKVQGN